MDTYSVEVDKRPLGIGLISACNSLSSKSTEEEVKISEVNPNSMGFGLGISIGDTLIAINGKAVKSVDDYFDYTEPLPLKLTFRKSDVCQLLQDPLSPKTIGTSNPLASSTNQKKRKHIIKKPAHRKAFSNNIRGRPLPALPQSISVKTVKAKKKGQKIKDPPAKRKRAKTFDFKNTRLRSQEAFEYQ